MKKNEQVLPSEVNIDSIYEGLPQDIKDLVEHGIFTKEEVCIMAIKQALK